MRTRDLQIHALQCDDIFAKNLIDIVKGQDRLATLRRHPARNFIGQGRCGLLAH